MKFVPLAVLSIALIAPIVAADAGTFECTATIGLSNPVFGASIPTPVGNLGGCSLVPDTATASRVVAVGPADGCEILADDNGDNIADKPVTPGVVFQAGTSISAFCDLGVADATNSVTLENA